MTDIEYDEWMSESDALLWHIERDPLLRSTVTSVWLLDSTPERDQMDAVVNRMISRLPRLRQRVIDDPNGIATPRWEDDPHVEASYHYRWYPARDRRPMTCSLTPSTLRADRSTRTGRCGASRS